MFIASKSFSFELLFHGELGQFAHQIGFAKLVQAVYGDELMLCQNTHIILEQVFGRQCLKAQCVQALQVICETKVSSLIPCWRFKLEV
jgi:hypothetical protein